MLRLVIAWILVPLLCGCGASAARRAPAAPPPEAVRDDAAEAERPPPIEVSVEDPRYAPGAGPRVAVDQAHHEVHSIDDRFHPFAEVLRQDGYRVSAFDARLDADQLAGVDVLVVANALHESNVDRWEAPTPSAFTTEEIRALVSWIEGGGRLWLIADHMPFPGAARELATALGFGFHDGFAFVRTGEGSVRGGALVHRRAEETIADHAITDGVEQVRSFTGQAFEAPADAEVLIRMPPQCVLLLTRVAWEFADAEELDCPSWPMAAVRRIGEGRVAVFGEAAMLSARWEPGEDGFRAVGFHDPEARDNVRLLRNVAAWLAEGH